MEPLARRVLAAFLGLWASFSLGLFAVACGPAEDSGAAAAQIEAGRLALSASRPDQARQRFAAALASDPLSPEAAFGLGLSELLMVPGSPAGQALAAELGLRPVEPAEDLFGPDGALADLGRTLDPAYSGRRLLARLGVPAGGWSGVGEWLVSLPETTSPASLSARAGELAAELGVVASWFEAAGDPRVEPLEMVIPGGLLHLESDLVVGPAEARLLAGLTRGARGLLRVVAAYRFSARPLAELAGLDGEALARALSALLADTGAPETLEHLRPDLRGALDQLTAALASGVATGARPGQIVAWDLVSSADLFGLAGLLSALAASLDGPAELPDTSPRTRLDASLLLSSPPAIPAEPPLFSVGEAGEPVLRLGLLEELLERAGASSPPLRFEEGAPTLFTSGSPSEGWAGRWLAPLLDRLESDLGL